MGRIKLINLLEIVQKIQLNAYNAGRAYQAGKMQNYSTLQNRIKLPICKAHDIDPLWRICKTCGMIDEEIFNNESR